jgi:hypothetical protein
MLVAVYSTNSGDASDNANGDASDRVIESGSRYTFTVRSLSYWGGVNWAVYLHLGHQ